MAARLVIDASAYTLSQLRDGQWSELAVLHGGADLLLLRELAHHAHLRKIRLVGVQVGAP
jgi:hypothetical protein